MSTELLARLETNMGRQQLSVETEASCRESTTEVADMLSQAAHDRYRCPEKFFDLVLNKQLSSDEGYFRFGPQTICYGRTCSGICGPRPESPLYDAIRDVLVDDGRLSLPFDPTEIIDNLRLERYANRRDMESRFEKLFRRLYYRLRPLTNLKVRKQIQKFRARNWKKQSFPNWPVDTTVEDICETLLLMSMEAKGVDRVPFVWFWPGGASGCLMMTHDVETSTGRDRCTALMDVDDSFGIKAAFGIVPEERYEVSPSLLESMRNRGFELVIQDFNHDGQLFDNKEEFLRRANIIIHPDYVMAHDTLSVYESLLGHLRELRQKTRIWSALPAEVDLWWRARSKMSVVKEGDSWRIAGDHSGRAVVAFAKN